MGVNRSERHDNGPRCEGDHIPSHPGGQAIDSHAAALALDVGWLLPSDPCKAARYDSRRGFKTI